MECLTSENSSYYNGKVADIYIPKNIEEIVFIKNLFDTKQTISSILNSGYFKTHLYGSNISVIHSYNEIPCIYSCPYYFDGECICEYNKNILFEKENGYIGIVYDPVSGSVEDKSKYTIDVNVPIYTSYIHTIRGSRGNLPMGHLLRRDIPSVTVSAEDVQFNNTIYNWNNLV